MSQTFRAEFPQQFAEARRQQEAFMTACDPEIDKRCARSEASEIRSSGKQKHPCISRQLYSVFIRRIQAANT